MEKDYHPCRNCGRTTVDAGRDLAVPRRADDKGWRTLIAVLSTGLTFHSCGCDGPGFRPRTPAEVRDRLAAARELGIPVAEALTLHDPDGALKTARSRRRGVQLQ
jgi:hypothetical protein